MSAWLPLDQAEFMHAASEETALFVLALVGGLSRDAVVTGLRLADKSGECSVEHFVLDLPRPVHGFLGLKDSFDPLVSHC